MMTGITTYEGKPPGRLGSTLPPHAEQRTELRHLLLVRLALPHIHIYICQVLGIYTTLGLHDTPCTTRKRAPQLPTLAPLPPHAHAEQRTELRHLLVRLALPHSDTPRDVCGHGAG